MHRHDGLALLILHRLAGFLVDLRSRLVDLLGVLAVILADHPDNARRVVNLRDKVNQNAARVPDGAAHVVDEMEGRNVTLTLAGHDGLAAGFIRPSTKRCVIHADDRLYVVRGVQGFLERARSHAHVHRLSLWWRLPVVLQECVRLDVGCVPAVNVGIGKAFRPDEGNFRGKRDQLSRSRAPIVKHPLCINGVMDQAAKIPLALDVKFIAINRNNRDVFTGPVCLLQNIEARHDPLLDLVGLRRAFALHLDDAERQRHLKFLRLFQKVHIVNRAIR